MQTHPLQALNRQKQVDERQNRGLSHSSKTPFSQPSLHSNVPEAVFTSVTEGDDLNFFSLIKGDDAVKWVQAREGQINFLFGK